MSPPRNTDDLVPSPAYLLERAAYYRALAAKETRVTKAAEYRDRPHLRRRGQRS